MVTTWRTSAFKKLSNNGAIFVAPQGIGNGWQNLNGRGPDFRRRHGEAHHRELLRRYDAPLRQRLQLRRRYELRNCVRTREGFRGVAIYNGAVLSGCEGGNDPIALWPNGWPHRQCLYRGRSKADARQVRREQRLHGAEPAPTTSTAALLEATGDTFARTMQGARASTPCVGACTSQVTATPSSMGPGTSIIRARHHPTPARTRVRVAGSLETCGRSSIRCRLT